jgi:hypothetical protein
MITHAPSLSAERPDVCYSLVAVDFLPPPAVETILGRLAADLASQALKPLPRVVHDLAAVRAALRQMSQARHVGKIVVRARTLQQQQPGSSKVRLLTVLRDLWAACFIDGWRTHCFHC